MNKSAPGCLRVFSGGLYYYPGIQGLFHKPLFLDPDLKQWKKNLLEQWNKGPNGCLGYIGDEILPNFVGIIS